MDYYSEDVNKEWINKIFSAYKVYVSREPSLSLLKNPVFEIFDSERYLGQYTGGEVPKIRISKKILNDFGAGAIKHVMGHEIAHLISDKIFNMNDLKSHGESFKKACNMLGVKPSATITEDELDEFDIFENKKKNVILKIKKLIALSESSVESEANLALSKARELMLKYNIESISENKEEDYIIRPVGKTYKKIPTYIKEISNLVSEFYFVNVIITYRKNGRGFEFFGTKENLDIAEHIFCCLAYQCDMLWKKYLKEKNNSGKYSKVSYLEGVVLGYKSKLKNNEEEIKDKYSLIWYGDQLLQEMYRRQYPSARNVSYYSCGRNGSGYDAGINDGKNLRISKGIGSENSYSGKLIAC
jgi:hypothetical protein